MTMMTMMMMTEGRLEVELYWKDGMRMAAEAARWGVRLLRRAAVEGLEEAGGWRMVGGSGTGWELEAGLGEAEAAAPEAWAVVEVGVLMEGGGWIKSWVAWGQVVEAGLKASEEMEAQTHEVDVCGTVGWVPEGWVWLVGAWYEAWIKGQGAGAALWEAALHSELMTATGKEGCATSAVIGQRLAGVGPETDL